MEQDGIIVISIERYKIERGERNISLDTLQKFLVLHITPSHLFENYDNKQTKELADMLNRDQFLLESRKEITVIEKMISNLLESIDELK
ncbi:hypothetical protein QCD85_08400 [Paenibacillus sp. PsM32]|uniref:hypothetical protein n=1 Tax=Paenibacillus sp. PsM32 TaxID=3030536 RepID=UPI00263BAFFD|nr:hypothetical protein [Paenibacillus sp. PsM32]MDN4618115.1 hypothetical protein [Paenibacillus sp. PsM32]